DSNDETLQEDKIIEDDCSSTSEQDYVPSDHEEEDSELEMSVDQDSNSSRDNVQSDHVTGVVSYKGKNGYIWKSEEPNKAVRTPKHNIIIKLPSLKPAASRLGNNPDVGEIWNLLFDNEMLNEIVLRTNEKLEIVRSTHKNSNTTDYKNTNLIEIRAFIGLLMLTAIFRSNHENMLSLFSNTCTGRPIFRAVMSSKIFEKLLKCIRKGEYSRNYGKRNRKTRKIRKPTNIYAICSNTATPKKLIIKPKDKQSSIETTYELIKYIDLSKLQIKIAGVNNIKNGGIEVRLQEKDMKELKNEMQERLPSNYEIFEEESVKPKIKIVGCKAQEKPSAKKMEEKIVKENFYIGGNEIKVTSVNYIQSRNCYTIFAEVTVNLFNP
ncbi:unnamed protein product, partial [Acanthoscelides obtectus]